MPRIKTALLVCLGMMSVCAAPARTAPTDPETALQEINAWYSEQIKQAREANTPINAVQLMKERSDRAKEALKSIDAAAVEPSKCFALAQLYQAAQRPAESVAAAKRFVESSPEPARKYTAQQLMLAGYQQAKDAESLRGLLLEMKPATPQMAASLASAAAGLYAPTVAEKLGVKAALELITKLEANVSYEELRKLEAERAKTPAAAGSLAAAAFSQADSTIAAIANGKAALLEKDGKTAEAQSVLEQAVKTLGPGNRMAQSLQSRLNLAKLPGSPAPALACDRKYGEFTGLDAYRGKVVVLDFFAHWCGPCKRGNPLMKKMYADLHDKGLEIVGVTRYYGYYKADKGLTPEAEFAKMKEYKDEEAISWPLIFGNNDNFSAYGVSGIPHYVVIDREGKVSGITVGYNEPLHAELRARVEKALGSAASR